MDTTSSRDRSVGFHLGGHLRLAIMAVATVLWVAGPVWAHPYTINSSMTYSASQPATSAAGVESWVGAAFDAANIGGSGVNSSGGANNGTANDASTYVNAGTIQGQTITTGSNANGYDVTSITVRMAGYTNNTATGTNVTSWNLNATNSPVTIGIGRINGTTFTAQYLQNFMAGMAGNPGSGSSANGSGTYITFTFPFSVHLAPNTVYAFDIGVNSPAVTSFEWLGTSANPYAGGTAYSRTGTTVTTLTGDRVFQVNMIASAAAPVAFSHPGGLVTLADLNRAKAKVIAGAQPWKGSYDLLVASKYAQTSRQPAPVATIIRGATGNNYTRTQEDAVSMYQLALRYYMTGDTSYANQAVVIANAWPPVLTRFGGDSNWALGAGLCGE